MGCNEHNNKHGGIDCVQAQGSDRLNWLFVLYNRVTGWFIPAQLLQTELSARRARTVVAANLVGLVVVFTVLAEFVFIRREISLPWLILSALVLLLLINLFVLRWTRSTKLVGSIAVFCFLAIVLVAAYSYGGGFASTMAWLPAVPITATFLVGRRLGFVTAIFAMAGAIALPYLDLQGHVFPYLLPREDLLRLGPFVIVSAIIYVALLGEAYEWANTESRVSLRAEREQRGAAEKALDQQKEQSLITLQAIADGVITSNADDQITYINPVAAQLTGWSVQDAMGRSLSEVFMLFDEYTHEPAGDFIQACLNDQYTAPVRNHVLLSYDGREMVIEHHASLIRDTEGVMQGIVVVFQDVTMERELTVQLRYQATHDPLSGLMNRHEFEHQVQQLVAERQHDTKHMLCTMDISQFKVINDSSGHAAGDELIKQFSEILKDTAREEDSVARLGGNEFALIIPDANEEMALAEIRVFREKLDRYRFNWEDKSFAIAVAIGLVAIDGSTNNVADLLNDADAARQAAKEKGRNRVHLYEPDDHALLVRRGEMRWAAYLNGAIEGDRFMLVRQTIAPLHFKEGGAHYEVLLRCRDEDGRIVSAEEFLTAAERYNLIGDIDRWVIRSLVDWYIANPEDLQHTHTASVNLSARSVTDTRFTREMMRQLHRIPGLAEKICLEITETAAIANLNKARKFMLEMRALGCRFALDDFGKGMSSLSYLKALPVDYLKIDGEFVKDMLNDPIDNAMVEHINQIAHVIGMKTIAEYAENEDIIERLRELKIDFAQGYGVDRPMPFEVLTELH